MIQWWTGRKRTVRPTRPDGPSRVWPCSAPLSPSGCSGSRPLRSGCRPRKSGEGLASTHRVFITGSLCLARLSFRDDRVSTAPRSADAVQRAAKAAGCAADPWSSFLHSYCIGWTHGSQLREAARRDALLRVRDTSAFTSSLPGLTRSRSPDAARQAAIAAWCAADPGSTFLYASS